MKKSVNYKPALRFRMLTKFFDIFLRITMSEKRIKNDLIEQGNILEKDKILDFGCGTGTLTIMIKKKYPQSEVFGVDIDKNILALAKNKVETQKVEVNFKGYDGKCLPYDDCSFDKIFSSLVFHHLKTMQKQITSNEIFRVLKPEGEFHFVDFGKPQNKLMRTVFL